MSINEMRSKVCKKAWELMKSDILYDPIFGDSKSRAFAYAWECVKQEAKKSPTPEGMVKACDLKPGDKVRFEYGDFDNVVTATITEKPDMGGNSYYIPVKVRFENGIESTVYGPRDSIYEIVA